MAIETLEAFKAAVKSIENADELINFHVAAVETEKTRGITEKRRANDEAKGLRAYKKSLESLGYDGAADLEEFIDSLKEKIETAGSVDPVAASETEKVLKSLRKEFDKTVGELKTEREQKAKIKQDSDRKTLTAKITEAIRNKVYGADIVAENLIANGRVALEDDGGISWVEGEERKAFDDGIKSYVDSRPDIVRNEQKGGAGSPPGQNGPSKKFSFDQIEGMSREEVRANLKDIKNSLGLITK